MNFDVRSYCERLESVNRGYRVVESLSDESYWLFGAASKEHGRALVYAFFCSTDLKGKLWAFIGPLADELGVRPSDILDAKTRIYWKDDAREAGLLEATFAAVCEKLEAAKEEAV